MENEATRRVAVVHGNSLLHARCLIDDGQGRFPGSRVIALTSSLPRPFRAEWRRDVGAFGGGLSGYSGGTAQAFDLLPFSPSIRGAP